MNGVDTSAFEDTRWYVWDTTPVRAIAQVSRHLKKLVGNDVPLTAKWTGLTRPGSYDYEGNAIDGYKENVGTTLRRYRVDVK